MKLKEFLGVEIEESQLMAEIDKAMTQGLPEIKIGEAIVKLPKSHFEKHIAPWEK